MMMKPNHFSDLFFFLLSFFVLTSHGDISEQAEATFRSGIIFVLEDPRTPTQTWIRGLRDGSQERISSVFYFSVHLSSCLLGFGG